MRPTSARAARVSSARAISSPASLIAASSRCASGSYGLLGHEFRRSDRRTKVRRDEAEPVLLLPSRATASRPTTAGASSSTIRCTSGSRHASRKASHPWTRFDPRVRGVATTAQTPMLTTRSPFHFLEDRCEQVALVAKVVVQRAPRHPRRPHDLLRRDIGIAPLGEELPRDGQQSPSSLRFRPCGLAAPPC